MMTPSQLATLKADILANADTNTIPMTYAGTEQIRALYNAASTTVVWRTEAPVKAIYDAIDWSKYTPTDAADGTTIQTNRMLSIQTKQMNLQNMLQGRETIDASKLNIRAGLRDAVIQLPSGASGAMVAAGGASGATVLTACTRKATRFEKLFSTGPVATGAVSANLLVLEGQLSIDDAQAARELP